jgi:alkanesulfonate monooxygenase SsuD/methylene tetrahydromethanopterin reductase-like flavin-dependent oxidoreductase (luciferase family)
MKFGILIVQATPTGRPERYPEILEQVQAAEELGYDYVWLTEHHFNEYGRPSIPTLAAHIAAKTRRIRIGISVIVLPFHHPIHVAEDVATVDHLAEGRIDFGMGRGSYVTEFDGFKIPREESPDRLEESYQIIKKAWTEEAFSHHGRFWSMDEVTVLPKPFQKPHPPIWQPAASPATIRKTVERGIHCLVGYYLRDYRDRKEKFFDLWHQTCQEYGRSDLRLGHNEFVHVAETAEQAYSEAVGPLTWYRNMHVKLSGVDTLPQQAYPDKAAEVAHRASLDPDYLVRNLTAVGSPEIVSDRIQFFADCGVEYLLNYMGFGPLPHDKVLRSMELFARYVMPRFQGARETPPSLLKTV